MKNKVILLLLLCSFVCCSCKDDEVVDKVTDVGNMATDTDSIDVNESDDGYCGDIQGSGICETTENVSGDETTEPSTSAEELTTENTTETSGIQVPDLTEEDIYASIIEEYRYIATTDGITVECEDYMEHSCKLELTMRGEDNAIGYGLYDIDGNGVKELLIGDEAYGDIVALYTISDDVPVNIFYGWSRNRYNIYSNGVIDNSGSSGAAYSEQHLFKINGADIEYIADFYFIEENLYYDVTGEGRSYLEVQESGYSGVEIVTSEFRDNKVKEITGEQLYSYDLIVF